MKVAVIGSGGREHALVRALSQSKNVESIHVLPGSDGMALDAVVHPIDPTDIPKVISLCKKLLIDLVVVGPEQPLVFGLSDQLREAGFKVFAPSQVAAQLETSKIFSKEFMNRHQIPTAEYFEVGSVSELMTAAEKFDAPYVLKADGLAGGKGVVICQDLNELQAWGHRFFVEKKFGVAGEKALLERFTRGSEISFFILTNGDDFVPLPLAKDHKKLGDQDLGPNTGGMGAIAPVEMDPVLYHQLLEEVVQPTVKGLSREGLLYRGVLYIGLILSPEGPSVLEYNVRFGDPEAQVLLPLLSGDWAEVFAAVAEGKVPKLKWSPIFAATVVMAASGYPENPVKGVSIEGDLMSESPSSYFIHAGTKRKSQDVWTVNGGRVLNSVGLGSTSEEARQKAYTQSQRATWPEIQFRKDIGT